jgi:hypothetical protein
VPALGHEGAQLLDFFYLERDDVFFHSPILAQFGLGAMRALEASPTAWA